MKELADVWGELTDITQANILEQIGGKRNANVVSSMLENFNVAEDVVKTAANSAGSALKENEKYLDSINGKIAEFKATFEELSMNFIDSDFVKQVIELGTGLLNVLNVLAKVIDKVGGLNTVLYVTVGILATIKADAIKTFLVTTLPGAIAKVTSAISTFVAGFKQLPTVIKAMNSQTALAVPGTSKLSVALKTLGISASTAQIAVGALMAVLTAAIIIYQAHKRAQEELRQEAITAANAAAEESNELAELTNKYIDLTSAMQDGNDVSEDLLSVKDQLIKKLDLESDKVKELVGDYADLNDKIKAATVVELQNAERDIRGGLNAYETELVNAAKPSLGTSMNSMSKSWNKKSATKYDSYKALQALEAAGYISSGSYSYYTDDADKKYSLGFAMYLPEEGFDLSTVDGIIAAHERLGEMLDIVQDKAGSTNEVYTTLYEQYNKVSEAIGNYENSIGDLNNNLAEQYMLQGLIGKELPSTQEEYDAYRQRVIDSAKESGEFIGSDTDIEAAVDSVLGQQAQFADFYNQAILIRQVARAFTLLRSLTSQIYSQTYSLHMTWSILRKKRWQLVDSHQKRLTLSLQPTKTILITCMRKTVLLNLTLRLGWKTPMPRCKNRWLKLRRRLNPSRSKTLPLKRRIAFLTNRQRAAKITMTSTAAMVALVRSG